METPAEVTPKVEPTVEAEATEAVPVPLPVAAPEPTTGGVSVPAPEPTPDTAQPSSAQPLPPGAPVMGAMPLPANVPVNGAVAAEGTSTGMIGEQMAVGDEDWDEDDEAGDGSNKRKRGGHGRRKIEIEYIEDKIRRHITFSKRKAGISKKAFELSRLTGAQVCRPFLRSTLARTLASARPAALTDAPSGWSLRVASWPRVREELLDVASQRFRPSHAVALIVPPCNPARL